MKTEKYQVMDTGAKLIILEGGSLRSVPLKYCSELSIGRQTPDNNPDIPMHSPIVSRKHGTFANMDGQWYFINNPDNLNGTFYNGVKIPAPINGKNKLVMLKDKDILRIDGDNLKKYDENGVVILFTTNTVIEGEWTSFPLRGHDVTTIGRGDQCDIVQPLPYFSEEHARITRMNGKYMVVDCDSTSGTYVNGELLSQNVSRELEEKDIISICDCDFFFSNGTLLYIKRDPVKAKEIMRDMKTEEKPVVLEADIRTKKVKNNSGSGMKELIKDVKLQIREGTLVALLGSAGAGKSTVMNCLNGMDLNGVEGSVTYRGIDLLKQYGRVKRLIGSVPQDKIINERNTPEEEFWDSAKRNLPRGTKKAEIQRQVDNCIKLLKLEEVRKSLNIKLSGGEKTRVNIGIDLVANHEMLCLDEPDQGLSPNRKHEIFEILADLAHKEGKTVLCIVHDVSEIDLFDQMIMMVKVDNVGRLAFSGTPADSRKAFGVERVEDIYTKVEMNPEEYVR